MLRFAVLLLPAIAFCQSSLEFSRLSPFSASAGPSPRVDGSITYDASAGRILLFGGLDASGDRNDLWAFSLATGQWSELNPLGPVPAARHGHTFTFDPVRRRAILIAGQSRGFFNDVWAFDAARNSWAKLSDDTGPSPRYAHSAIYDSKRDRVIISHGFTSESGRFDDTWAFNLKTNAWFNMTPTGTKPLRRCLHHAVYDEEADEMLLYGGCSSGFGPCPQGDLWAFDIGKSAWTQRAATPSPPARERYGMAFDPTRRLLILFAGGGTSGLLSDVWTYNPATNVWAPQDPAGDSPGARNRVESVFVADRNAAVFFGGYTGSNTNELLQLAAPAPPTRIRSAFSGVTSAVSPGAIHSFYGSGLGPASGAAASYDPTGFLPRSLSGTEVRVNGIAAPLYFVRSDQINFQVPYEIGTASEAVIRVLVNGAGIYEERLPVQPVAPDLHPAFTQTVDVAVFYASGFGVTNPATASGERATQPRRPSAPVTLRIGDLDAEILYAALAPDTSGVLQINARIPAGIHGATVVTLRIGSAEAQTTFRFAQ